MIKTGLVVKLDGGRAVVTMPRYGACGSKCEDCSACETQNVSISLQNHIGAKPGDFVEIDTNDKNMLKKSILMYTIPLGMFLFGFIFAYVLLPGFGLHQEVLPILLGFVFLFFSHLILKKIDKRVGDTDRSARIIKILE